MPAPEYYSPELIRKAAEAVEAEQNRNRNFEDYEFGLSELLFGR